MTFLIQVYLKYNLAYNNQEKPANQLRKMNLGTSYRKDAQFHQQHDKNKLSYFCAYHIEKIFMSIREARVWENKPYW